MAWQTTWAKIKLRKSWLNSSLIIYIIYLSIYILNHTVLSSPVCSTESQNNTCHCINEDTKAVHCLLGYFNDSCREDHARKSYQLFCEVMSQFNCEIKYSVKWNCTDCLGAYTKWLLAVFKPNDDNTWLSRCIEKDEKDLPSNIIVSLCKDVLAKCPYFAPQDSYGDTPAFYCPLNEEDYKSWIWKCS